MVREVRVEGAGYLNFFLDRPAVRPAPARGAGARRDPAGAGKVIVEHTNINPNKAAHIGHLRNAVPGRRAGGGCCGASATRSRSRTTSTTPACSSPTSWSASSTCEAHVRADIAALPEPFDYYCWDLYSEVGRWYEEDPERQRLRRETLHALESGEGERAEIGRLVARRVVRRHLATMARLGVGYDLLTHESDILASTSSRGLRAPEGDRRHRLETEGKNAGCWVMPLAQSEEFAGLEDPTR
jgi:arginyl-tRNA synthetase